MSKKIPTSLIWYFWSLGEASVCPYGQAPVLAGLMGEEGRELGMGEVMERCLWLSPYWQG